MAPSPDIVADVLAAFGLRPDACSIRPLGEGHIHRTSLVQADGTAFVLQELNAEVFPDLDGVAANIEIVVSALAMKHQRGEYPLEIPAPRATLGGNLSARVAGSTWRLTLYVADTYTLQEVDTAQRAGAAAQAFGSFCAALVEVDPGSLVETIPGFHDVDLRLEQFETASRYAAQRRAAGAASEIDYVRAQADSSAVLAEVQAALPQRVCHNDTKVNNLLFDQTDHRPRAVIDLDTCMPGWWMHDFGDIVRTFCSPEPEDSVRHDRVRVRDEVFEAAVRGFTTPLERHFASGERDSLWLGAWAIPLLIGMRFLTDHLSGDPYFGVSRENQNLDRARNQLALHRDLISRENELRPKI